MFSKIAILDKDFVYIRDQWPEIPIELGIIKNKIPYPTAIINSGNGYHCYWVLTEKLFDITNLIKAMQMATGADPRTG